MTFLVIAAVIGLIPALIASSKGRNFLLWYVYGFLLFVIALIHSIVLKPDRVAVEDRVLSQGDMRKCPHCAELIKREARVCRFCGRDLVAQGQASEPAAEGA